MPDKAEKCPVCDYDMLTGECCRTYDNKLEVCGIGCYMQHEINDKHEKNSLAHSETTSEQLASP